MGRGKRSFIIGIGSCDYGSPEVPQSAGSFSLSLKAQDPGGRMSQLKSRQRIHPSSTILFYLGPGWTGWLPPHWGGPPALPKTPSHTPRNNVSPAIWVSLGPAKLTPRMNHHKLPRSWCRNREGPGHVSHGTDRDVDVRPLYQFLGFQIHALHRAPSLCHPGSRASTVQLLRKNLDTMSRPIFSVN